jgi:penicillin-binding protein-related factor A (putative recombinase)
VTEVNHSRFFFSLHYRLSLQSSSVERFLVFESDTFSFEQKETKIQERFKMVAAHRGLKAFSMRPALASQE